jgi:hypothetical protein
MIFDFVHIHLYIYVLHPVDLTICYAMCRSAMILAKMDPKLELLLSQIRAS